MVYTGNFEHMGGLFSRGTISLDGVKYPTPLKAYPGKKLLDTDQSPKSSTRQIAELYCKIDTTDLEEYELYLDDERDHPPDFVEEKLENPLSQIDRDPEIVVTFFEIKETQELGDADIRRYLKLSRDHSDIIVMPHQWELIRWIFNSTGRMNPDADLPDNPFYTAYYNGVTRFLEMSESLEEPRMGIVPLFDESHKRNAHIEDFSENELVGICIDLQQQHPDNVDELPLIFDGFERRGRLENSFFYALNPPYTSKQNDDGSWRAEDFLLGARGFDVIGESHFGFGSRNGPIEDIRVFNKETGIYEDVVLNRLWRICDDSGFSGFELEQNPDLASDSKRLLSCEQIQMEFGNLRDAIDAGTVVEYLGDKDGISQSALNSSFSLISTSASSGTMRI